MLIISIPAVPVQQTLYVVGTVLLHVHHTCLQLLPSAMHGDGMRVDVRLKLESIEQVAVEVAVQYYQKRELEEATMILISHLLQC